MSVDNRKALIETADVYQLMDAIKVATGEQISDDPEIEEIASAIRSFIEENGIKLEGLAGKTFDQLNPWEIAWSLELHEIAKEIAHQAAIHLEDDYFVAE